jgi:release factor glutamine methyltransferase
MVLLEPYGDDSLEKNAKRLCENKNFNIEIIKKTFEEFEFNEKFDLILSNPPYIRFSDPDVAHGVYEHEPHEALFGGEFGWEKVVAWVEKSYTWLTENGLLVFEISHDQRQTVEEHLSKYKPEVHKDSFGKDRFFVIEYRGEVTNG